MKSVFHLFHVWPIVFFHSQKSSCTASSILTWVWLNQFVILDIYWLVFWIQIVNNLKLELWKFKRTCSPRVGRLRIQTFFCFCCNGIWERSTNWVNFFPCLPSGLNFINVLRTAFKLADPESIKRYLWLDCILYAFGIYERKSCT